MKKYMLIMMTSVECPHCHELRGKGILGCGAHFMKPSVIRDILSTNTQVNMVNIEFQGGGEARNIVEISKIYRDGDNLVQEMWCKSQNSVKAMTVYAYGDTKKFLRTRKEFKGDWSELVGAMVPSKISNYTFYYPCFMMVETRNWLDSINRGHELYAVTNAGKTIKDGETIKLDKDGKSLNERMMEPIELIKGVISGEIPLGPSPEKKVPEPPSAVRYARY